MSDPGEAKSHLNAENDSWRAENMLLRDTLNRLLPFVKGYPCDNEGEHQIFCRCLLGRARAIVQQSVGEK